MRTIVRCAMLAPALALGLPAVRAENTPEQKAAPAAPPPRDPAPAPASVPPAKPIPPFLAKAPAPLASPHPATVAVTLTANGSQGDDSAGKPPTNPEVSSSIRRSFPYVFSSAPATDAARIDDTLPVVDMNPFHVSTSRIVERATKGMEERRQQEREKAFNAKDGGRFGKIGPAEIGLKFDPKHKGWDILSIPW